MKFGAVVPMIGEQASTDAIDAVAAKAEAIGLDSLWVVDHILLPYSIGAKYPYNLTGEWVLGTGPWWESFSVMSYLAARTERVQLGTGVIVLPYRHPVHIAKTVATIDRLSKGRVLFGIGVGWMEDEFRNLNLDSFHHRGALTDEYLDIFKEVWAPDPCSFEGRWHHFDQVSVTPKPVQQPHPPILVGGNTDAALRRTVERADGWFAISLRPHELVERRAFLAQTAEQHGRTVDDFPTSMLHGIRLTDDPDERATLPDHDRRQSIVGTVEQIVEELREFDDAGLTHIVGALRRAGQPVNLETSLDNLEFLMTEIAPQLR